MVSGIGFMTWMWVSIIVVLVGAKLNAELDRRSAPDLRAAQAKKWRRRYGSARA